MSRQRLLCAPLLLAAASVLPGCALVAGAGVGYVVSQQVLGDVHVSQVQDDVDRVWAVTQETLAVLVDPGTDLSIQDYPRVAKCRIGGAEVVVEVEAYDLDRTLLRVKAKKYLASDGATAAQVMGDIIERLEG